MKRLKELRKERRISQTELGQMIGVATSSISEYESGKISPPDELKIKIADYFGVTLDYLLGRSNIRDATEYTALKDDPELLEFWEVIRANPDFKLLYKKSKELTPNAIKQMVRIIKTFEEGE